MNSWVSMASTFHEIVDCRMVQFELEFHQVTKRQLVELAQLCATESSRLFSEKCYCQWKFGGHRKPFPTLLKSIESSSTDFNFDFEGDVLSDVVYDQKTFRKYEKQLQDGSKNWRDIDISRDYFEYFREWIAGVQDSAEYLEALLRILNEPGRRKKALWRCHDFSGLFTSCRYSSNKSMFRGAFCLSIALPCLNQSVTEFTAALINMLQKAGAISQNVSGRIALSPISSPAPCSPHMLYFGGTIRNGQSHTEMGLYPNEWYPYYYFCGAEWFNYLSPLQASHLDISTKEALNSHNQINATLYSNGAISTKLRKNIDQVDVEDLHPVRRILYRALYPGQSEISLSNLFNPGSYGCFAKIRQEWECIPVFPDEIEIDEERISFNHH